MTIRIAIDFTSPGGIIPESEAPATVGGKWCGTVAIKYARYKNGMLRFQTANRLNTKNRVLVCHSGFTLRFLGPRETHNFMLTFLVLWLYLAFTV